MTVSTVSDLMKHTGHEVSYVMYGVDDEEPVSITIECETCGEVLFEFHVDENGRIVPGPLDDSAMLFEFHVDENGRIVPGPLDDSAMMAPEWTEDYWKDDPDFPASDWQAEVANGDTRRGYWEWVDLQKQCLNEDKELESILAQEASHA